MNVSTNKIQPVFTPEPKSKNSRATLNDRPDLPRQCNARPLLCSAHFNPLGHDHFLKWIDRNYRTEYGILKTGALIGAAFVAVVFSYTVQVWAWAAAFISMGALPNLSDALYFSIVTYTTLGYGDIIVGQEFRIFAAMAALTGLLNLGLSTAFLVGLFGRILKGLDD